MQAKQLNYELWLIPSQGEGEYKVAQQILKRMHLRIHQHPLNIPPNGVTPSSQPYSYHANDASVGDVDGDGEYEIILKWDPSNTDNAHDGYTGHVYMDCYRLNGEQLWRIDLGRNVRAGAHYTQFIVFDLDGDNKAEVVIKTGTEQ